ncbi:hypothetical protein TUM19329_09810 [Legionella antarctica]|uniref:Protein kinase domain-containing protein n=1 Tax=Legionella antarctica TaxID=2708020 RepID=A0A6F8T383_9GAMM|nr:protein kinase [Legionella antarctica]BCA94620.1 hypothetical protein TUM19329_09810 [Legionella antarctica]
MNIDLLNLSDETIFYLKKLVKDYASLGDSSFLNKSTYKIQVQEYSSPILKSDESRKEKEFIQPGSTGLANQICQYLALSIKNFPSFFMVPSPVSPLTVVPKPPRQHYLDIELSHHILVKKEANQFRGYIVAKNTLGSGAFGSVFDSPASFVFDIKSDELTYNLTDHVVKNLANQGDSKARAREFNHLKLIFPSTDLVEISRDQASTQNLSNTFNTPFKTNDYWIVTKKIEGLALDKVNVEILTTPQKLKIALSLMWELYQLHNPALLGGLHIHNDIKPSNIIVTKDCEAHYCDFGSATDKDEPVQTFTIKYSNKTSFSQPAKQAGDIYSLAITLFQLFISSKYITQEISRWNILPKGKNEKLHKIWKFKSADTGLLGAKVLKTNSQQKIYQFFHPKTKTLVCDIGELDKKQKNQIVTLLKQMRKDNPLTIEEAYNTLLELASAVKGFDADYFSDKKTDDIPLPLYALN